MNDENKTADTATPVNTTDAATATPTQAAPTQTENNGQTTTTTEAKTEAVATDTPKDTGIPKGVKSDLYKLRSERREMREKIERLEKMVAEMGNKSTPVTKEEPVGLFDDPEKRLEIERKNIKSEVLAEINRIEAEKQRTAQIQAEGQRTIEMLLAKPEISGDMEKISEIDEIILNDARLSQIVKISPELAGKEAYDMWAKEKGIDNARKQVVATAKASTSAPASSPMTATPKRTLSDIQKEASMLDASDPKFGAKWEALMSEYREMSK